MRLVACRVVWSSSAQKVTGSSAAGLTWLTSDSTLPAVALSYARNWHERNPLRAFTTVHTSTEDHASELRLTRTATFASTNHRAG